MAKYEGAIHKQNHYSNVVLTFNDSVTIFVYRNSFLKIFI